MPRIRPLPYRDVGYGYHGVVYSGALALTPFLIKEAREAWEGGHDG
jgi:hypothetical protein